MKTIVKALRVFIALSAVAALIGCGYTLVNVKKQVPPDVKKVCIPSFINFSDEPSMGFLMASALTRELLKSGAMIPTAEKDADATLVGTVSSVKFLNRVYNEDDKAVLVTVAITAGLKLVKKSGEVVWELPEATYTEDYTFGADNMVLDSGKETALEYLAGRFAIEFNDRLIFGF